MQAGGHPIGLTLIVLLCLVAVLSGCSDGRPRRVRVSGTVLIDGQPLTFGNIIFMPQGARPSSAKLDENGHFKLSCYDAKGDGDGAIPGKHKVAISSSKPIPGNKVQWYAPKKYADFRTSGLEFDITEPTDDLTINLSWDGGKPFVE